MKTAMDYVKERDERVDVAGKTARLKDWCEKFFDDKNWDIRDDGKTQSLEPFRSTSGVWVRITLLPHIACYRIGWDWNDEDTAAVTGECRWDDFDIEEFHNKIEAQWAQALQKAPPIPQIYYEDRIPVNDVPGAAE